jgi:hypothetical protein
MISAKSHDGIQLTEYLEEYKKFKNHFRYQDEKNETFWGCSFNPVLTNFAIGVTEEGSLHILRVDYI